MINVKKEIIFVINTSNNKEHSFPRSVYGYQSFDDVIENLKLYYSDASEILDDIECEYLSNTNVKHLDFNNDSILYHSVILKHYNNNMWNLTDCIETDNVYINYIVLRNISELPLNPTFKTKNELCEYIRSLIFIPEAMSNDEILKHVAYLETVYDDMIVYEESEEY